MKSGGQVKQSVQSGPEQVSQLGSHWIQVVTSLPSTETVTGDKSSKQVKQWVASGPKHVLQESWHL